MAARRSPGVRLQATLRRWRAELARPGPGEERVHAARVVLKQARAVTRLFRDRSPDFDARAWDGRLRRALQAMGSARDEVVVRAILERSARKRPEVAALVRALPAPTSPSPSTIHLVGPLLDDLGRSLGPVAQASGWDPLDRAWSKAVRRVRRLQKAAAHDETPALWHRWRRRVKELAYQAEWVRPPDLPRWPSLKEKAWNLQSKLGDLQDLQVTLARLATLELPPRARKYLRSRLGRAVDTAQRRAWRARLGKKSLRG